MAMRACVVLGALGLLTSSTAQVPWQSTTCLAVRRVGTTIAVCADASCGQVLWNSSAAAGWNAGALDTACVGRNEIGVYTGKTLAQCKAICDGASTCISIEFQSATGKCHASTSCTVASGFTDPTSNSNSWDLYENDFTHALTDYAFFRNSSEPPSSSRMRTRGFTRYLHAHLSSLPCTTVHEFTCILYGHF